jgi:all-trans-retinol 13,14-reductase
MSYDAIVIGSGMGGLTTASLLAQLRGKRVLVLEKHGKLGGYTHTFKRQAKYKWDVGLHYVGGMAPGESGRQLMDLVTGGQVEWQCQPDEYDIFRYPDFEVRVRRSRAGFIDSFLKVFSQERASLEAYLDACIAVTRGSPLLFTDFMLPKWTRPVLHGLPLRSLRLAKRTTAQVLEQLVPNPQLRAALVSQWMDYGLPPSRSSFLVHATIALHYLDGGYYPVGGSNRIAEAVKAIVESKGGELKSKAEVDKILLSREGKVRAVRLTDGTEYEAPIVVSDAGARNTYLRLLPEAAVSQVRTQIKRYPLGFSVATLFLGLKRSPSELGLKGENYWLFEREDHEQIYGSRNRLVSGLVTSAYASFPSLKDPQAAEHVAEILVPTDLEPFQKWLSQPVKQRDEEYQLLKKKIAQAILEFTEKRIPGISELVDHAELATPLTNLHYSAHPGGAIYGIPATPRRFFESWARPRTPIPGLYLTGSDAMMHGILGALMGGVMGMGAIEGFRALGEVFSHGKGAGKQSLPTPHDAQANTDKPVASPP